jgi:hypothetical protein
MNKVQIDIDLCGDNNLSVDEVFALTCIKENKLSHLNSHYQKLYSLSFNETSDYSYLVKYNFITTNTEGTIQLTELGNNLFPKEKVKKIRNTKK